MCYTIIKEREEDKRKENKTMTRQEIEKKIETLEKRRFFLNMKDGWNYNDFQLDDKLKKEIEELEKMLDR